MFGFVFLKLGKKPNSLKRKESEGHKEHLVLKSP